MSEIICNRCGECCKIMILKTKARTSVMQEYFKARGFYVEGETATLVFDHRCPHLTSNNLCDINDRKPIACRVFPYDQPMNGIVKKDLLPEGCAWDR